MGSKTALARLMRLSLEDLEAIGEKRKTDVPVQAEPEPAPTPPLGKSTRIANYTNAEHLLLHRELLIPRDITGGRVPHEFIDDPEAYGWIIANDSMEAPDGYRTGDVVLLSPAMEPKPNDDVLVKLRGEAPPQVRRLFDRIQFDETTRDWFGRVLRARAKDTQQQGQEKWDSLAADLRRVQQQKDRLVNMRLNDEIDADSFTCKQAELREREGELQLQMEAAGREQSEIAELAVKAFELSQSLPQRWVTADIAVKRQILEIVCLNWTLDGVTLVPTIRKPFSVLAEGLVSADNRGDRI